MVDSGMLVDLFCIQDEPSDSTSEEIGALRITRILIVHDRGGTVKYLFNYLRFMLSVFLRLTWRSIRKPYDVVHVHNMPSLLVFCAVMGKLQGVPVILDLHDVMPEVFAAKYRIDARHALIRLIMLLDRLSIAFADLALTPNETFRQVFISRGCPSEKIHIVMNTPDEAIFHPTLGGSAMVPSSDKTSFRIIYHGLIAERHGLSTAVEAISLLVPRIPGLILDIYGVRTRDLTAVEKQIVELGLTSHVRYCGKRRLEEIPALIETYDLGIIPNKRTPHTEINFPTRIFEYLSIGKACIVPNTRGIREYFGEHDAVFFEPDSAISLARAIEWAYQDPAQIDTITQRGREIYKQHRWLSEKCSFLNILEQLLLSRRVRKRRP
jgi:glycosyltransferase involved in cell wall biosynthesis